MRIALVLAAFSLLFAGCISSAQDPVTPSDDPSDVTAARFAALVALGADVPCEAAGVSSTTTSDNLLTVGNVLYDESTHGEVDAFGDWMLVARYAAGGLEVVSLHDPASPRWVATYQSEEKNAQDVKWMPDGRTAVIGINGHIELVDIGPVMDADLNTLDALENTVVPELVSTWVYPGDSLFTNMHMVTTARIADVDYIFVAPNDDTGYWTLKLVGEGADRKLETVGNFGTPLGGGPLGPHDMSLVWDIKTEKPLMYVANGFEGWLVYDLSDPAKPIRLAVMPNLGIAQGYTHTVLGQQVGDRRIVVTIAEVGSNVMNVFDATNFQAPILLAQWWADKTNPTLPQHNIQIVGDRLYVAHYTHGVYVFDLAAVSTIPLAGTATLAPVAHYMPTHPVSGDTLGFANTWDIIVHRGVLYVNDSSGHGTDAVIYGCLTPGDEMATSKN